MVIIDEIFKIEGDLRKFRSIYEAYLSISIFLTPVRNWISE